jgi:hypothetical protein
MSSETSSLQSNSESNDESDVEISELFSTMQQNMRDMIDEVDESLETLHSLEKDLHHSQDLYEHLHLQESLEHYLTQWVKEKRMFENGFYITLTKEEQEFLGLESINVSIYDICVSIVLQKTQKTV